MTITKYALRVHGYFFNKGVQIGDEVVNSGNALNLGGGVFLTAAHLFDGFEPGGEFKAESQDISVSQDQNIDGVSVPAPTYLYPYDPSLVGSGTVSGNDLAFVQTGIVTDTSELTPVVVFADPTAANTFLAGRPMSLATVTPDHEERGVSLSVPQDKQFLASISTTNGDSGGSAVTILNNVSYVEGILSGSTADTKTSTFSYLNTQAYDQACAAILPGSNFSTLPPDLIEGAAQGEHIRGTQRKADIITDGSNDIILAGSGGGLIDTETGTNDVVFLPSADGQADPGTIIVLSPGSKVMVGGGLSDQLVFLADRFDPLPGTPPSSPADASDVVPLLGGKMDFPADSSGDFSAYCDTAEYGVSYLEQAGDLFISIQSAHLNESAWTGWSSYLDTKNYQQGDFGLNLSDTDPPQGMSEAEQSTDDDPNVAWSGQFEIPGGFLNYGDPNFTPPSSAQIAADLAAVEADTQGSGTPIVEPSPSPDAPIVVAAGASVTVTASGETVNASGAGSTIDLYGTSETASISAGTVNLGSAASAAITGSSDTIALAGNGAAAITGANDIVTVAGAGNGVSVSAATITLADQARLTLHGSGDTIALGNTTGLDASASTGDTVNVSGTGVQALVTAGTVNVGAGAGVAVTGDGNTYTLASNAQLTASGSNSRVTLTGSGDTVSLTGSGASLDVSGSGQGISASSAAFTLETGARATVQGNADTFSLASNAGLDASSDTGSVVDIKGTGIQLAVGAAAVGLDANTSASVWATETRSRSTARRASRPPAPTRHSYSRLRRAVWCSAATTRPIRSRSIRPSSRPGMT